MELIESIHDGGPSGKVDCDFCNEQPENGVLVEKPNSMIFNGQVQVSLRAKPLFVCLTCLQFEVENL
ncbi:hypothetical protein [Paenibacillus hubeiensis]|uniref:hypothetical protein n=1 Tax=Paenibacillus hubeiensis TaxID=3077330 RepID=UPI0031BA9946